MLKKHRFVLFLAVLSAASMWFYVQRIMIPGQLVDASLSGRPRGNLSDLYPRWLGTRELLLHHRSPYSPEVTREIQIGYYGRPLDASRPADPKDQQGFAYPVYVTFFLAPTIFFPFTVVQPVFSWFLALLTCLAVLLWLRVLQWKPPIIVTAVLLLLTLGCFPFAQGFKLQQLTLLVCGLIAGCAVLMTSERFLPAGILLATATIKPQLVLLLSLWLLLWALSEWRSRKRFIFGFGSAITALLAGAQFILPDWIKQFYGAAIAYRQYTGGGGSVLEELTTPLFGKFLAAAIVIALASVCWKSRRAPVNSPQFICTTVLVLAVTSAVIPMVALYNQLLLLPAAYLLVREGNFFSKKNPLALVVSSACLLLIVWPWFAAIGLSTASCFLPAAAVQRAWTVPLYTSLAIPPAIVVLLVPTALGILRRPHDSLKPRYLA